jgi:hypothetical protein
MRADLAPIGLLTRNRHVYLDATLRSLSATGLPAKQPVIVFDDASDEQATVAYLYGSSLIPAGDPWPRVPAWGPLGLDILWKQYRSPHGLLGKVAVERLGGTPLGVVNASCQMICRLFKRYPDAPGVILLQDDVIFNHDWYMQMLINAGRTEMGPIGLLSGCRLNKPLKTEYAKMSLLRLTHSTTAQCLYLAREAYEREKEWFSSEHNLRSGFDNHLCTTVRRSGHVVCMTNPAVCQHTGLLSLVRPKLGWHARGKRGRISYEARPPYVLADRIKTFAPCE